MQDFYIIIGAGLILIVFAIISFVIKGAFGGKRELLSKIAEKDLEIFSQASELDTLNNELDNLNGMYQVLDGKYKKIVNQKKSSEVRLGKIAEHMVPFFGEWPYDPNNFRFIGSPIDGIQFTDKEIIFMEIKTGKARLTNSQKSVKQLVADGKIKFATFRVGEDGCNLKLEEANES
jgi:predicted Holliday junction resolvase-like endonuclease